MVGSGSEGGRGGGVSLCRGSELDGDWASGLGIEVDANVLVGSDARLDFAKG